MARYVGQDELFVPRGVFGKHTAVRLDRPPRVTLLAVALALVPLVGLAAESPPLIFEAPPRFTELADRLGKLHPQAIRLEDQTWGVWIGLTATVPRLEEIDRLFSRDPPSVQKAYLLSAAADDTHDLDGS